MVGTAEIESRWMGDWYIVFICNRKNHEVVCKENQERIEVVEDSALYLMLSSGWEKKAADLFL